MTNVKAQMTNQKAKGKRQRKMKMEVGARGACPCERFCFPLYQFAEIFNSGSQCEERKRRGILIVFDFIMNEIASLRSQ